MDALCQIRNELATLPGLLNFTKVAYGGVRSAQGCNIIRSPVFRLTIIRDKNCVD